ncbi:MAG: sigma-70 family RNA polymerase sigma factor [Clostridia bacterium]
MLMMFMTMLDSDEEKQKITTLYELYCNLMLKVAFSVVRDYDLSNDIVQDSFYKIIKVIDNIDDVYSKRARNLVVIIVKNTAINELGRRNRAIMLDFDEVSDLKDDHVEPDDEVINSFVLDQIPKKIKQLPPKYRDVLQLKFDCEFSNVQIAEVLGISQELCRKRLQRGRQLLLKSMKEGELM